MWVSIPIIINLLSDSSYSQTLLCIEIGTDHRISKFVNISTITIIVSEVTFTLQGAINQIIGHAVFLAGHQHIGVNPVDVCGVALYAIITRSNNLSQVFHFSLTVHLMMFSIV